MKKVLFATTALVVTAGAAAADVSLSGRAEMGVFGTNVLDTQFFTDIDVTFTMSGETDGGLVFGAAVDLDEALNEGGTPVAFARNGAFGNNADDGGIAIFISGDFGSLTMGDTDGALDFAMRDGSFGNAGSIGDEETGHEGYLGSYGDGMYDGQILRYDYSFGDFAVAVSVEMDNAGVRDVGYAVGASYNFGFTGGSATIGGGYQYVDAAAGTFDSGAARAAGDLDIIGVSASVSLDSGISAMVGYTMFEDSAGTEQTHIAVGAGYSFDAFTVAVNYGIFESDPAFESSGFGLSAAYDFGGGLSAHLGYGDSEVNGVDTDAFSLGLAMSF